MIYTIDDITFDSKKAAQQKAKEILYNGNLNSELLGCDFQFMKCYFELFHVDWDLKKGVGVRAITRIIEPNYKKYRAFNIIRTDNSSTDISYIINKIQKKNYFKEFQLAMRELIIPQINDFRKQAFSHCTYIVCPETAEKVTYQNSHVDHVNPKFNQLVISFIKKYNIKITPELFPKEEDNQTIYRILDDDISNKFIQFHKQYAKLRITSKKGNLTRKRK